MKTNIKNLSLSDLGERLKALGFEGYRARQVKKWLYQKDVSSFDEMTNLGKEYRRILSEHFSIPSMSVHEVHQSIDGTRKYLIELPDGKSIESVMIPTESRNTLCISTQVGCAMGCKFCYTGTMGLARNLTIFEILEQVAVVRRDLDNSPQPQRLTNLVFMGMGEPLVNTKSLYPALEILIDPECFGFSRHHVTVSTVGIAPEIEKFGDKTPVKLAVSLHATTDEVRGQMMPINKKFSLTKLFESLKKMSLPKRNRITFEYVLLHGVNDSLDDARRLAKLLSQVPAKINLLLFNEFPGAPYKRPPDEWVLKFQKILLDKGYVAVIRKSRGRDILGACGQLAIEKSAA
ncbi:MAG: 23S rRNA (adenine(2503)-C(2))-methyltransferase RlmN [Deltaproteobacteria bacterium]|nr:23S rRNA (adenine(2503)-C(2))-methyltransferase RlmN [Deltaproteobacteria bacterium]